MKAQTFAKKVMVTIHPHDSVFTVLAQFGEEGDELPYPLLVEMPFDTAVRLRQELGEWLPLLQAKTENRHSEGQTT